jgi:endonuclease/exonuclease/phosphatase family metal-dependent hydrolase
MSFRVASYNVLADIYAKEEVYPYATFADRPARIIARILSLDADVVCLQEVSAKLIIKLQRAFKTTHFISFAAYRSGTMGLATIVRRSSGFIIEHERAMVVCPMYSDDPETFGIHLDNICLMTHIRREKSKGSPTFARVINTHAPCIPGTPRISEVFVEKLLRLCGAQNNLIVAGDFNMLPDSPGYQRMTLSLNPCTDPEQKTTQSICHRSTEERSFSGAIDFIFASKSLKIILEPTVEILGLLPNSKEPSDHVPITCTFC